MLPITAISIDVHVRLITKLFWDYQKDSFDALMYIIQDLFLLSYQLCKSETRLKCNRNKYLIPNHQREFV